MLTCCAWRFLRSARLVAKLICRWEMCCIYTSIPNFFFIKSDTCLASWHSCFPESDSSLLTNSRESGASSWYATGGSPSRPKSRAIAPIHWNTAVRCIAWQKDNLYETMKHHYMRQLDTDLFGISYIYIYRSLKLKQCHCFVHQQSDVVYQKWW